MSWTREQETVIRLRGGNLLVSAAAGSGKTAVLVERILQRITDPAHPVDIDRILVVTFTKAAASEMRERIADALLQRLEEDPEDGNLQRQSALLQNAKICTIDSFCQSVIKNQFFRIDLEPVFRIGDDAEMKVMKQDILDRVLEERYQNPDPAFAHCTEHFSGDRTDTKLKEKILQIYEYAMSDPWPRQYLARCRDIYRISEGEEDSWLRSNWLQDVTCMLREQLCGIADQFDDLARRTHLPGAPYMYEDTMRAQSRVLRDMAAEETFEKLQDALRSFVPVKLAVCRDKQVDAALKKTLQDERTGLLKQAAKLQKDFAAFSVQQMCEQMQAAAPDAAVLCDLTEEFLKAFQEEKRRNNILDFSDLEHDALRILIDEETGQPTAAALEYQEYFEEIMIDEYQDSNYVQELILTGVSRQKSLHPNVFMVGDVKQSIYGFRMARPDLFMNKYTSYADAMMPDVQPQESGCNARIELRVNFRSRPGVLRSVNAVFERLMREDIGGISYGQQNALYPGPDIYPPQEPEAYRTEVLLTEKDPQAEAAMAAQRIRALTDPAGPLLISDREAGGLRSVQYRDIVILMRSLGDKADTMAQTLNDAGIPAHVQSRTGYFAAPEIRILLSFLQIIDNPRQDIPLAAVLKSPVYDLRADDLARIRTAAPEAAFYDAVTQYAGEGTDANLREKVNTFLKDLADYRAQSMLLPIHELLAYLLRKSSYDKIVTAMPGGKQRLMNVRMLQERAAAFEQTSYHGLFQFNRYMEQLRTFEMDYGEASAVGENENAVRITTIHQSKGLEYPVVFLSALGTKFNKKDLSAAVQMNERFGIGIDAFRQERRTKTPTILKKAIRMLNESESAGEEMRVLYVGMTRAREKLILTAGVKEPETYAAKMHAGTGRAQADPAAAEETYPGHTGKRPLSFYDRIHAECFLDWICAALSEEDGNCLVRYVPAEDLARADAVQIAERRMRPVRPDRLAAQADPADVRMLQELFAPHRSVPADLPAKVSVSELKLDRIRENGEDPEELFAQTHQKSYVPSFAREEETLQDGASYGTAVHRVLECLDFAGCAEQIAKTGDAQAALIQQLDAMLADGRISREIYAAVSRRALTGFLKSSLFDRMQKADRAGVLYKERPFVMSLSAQEVRADYPEEETVLVQGIIDAYFVENEQIVLVDYKTDRVKEAAELTERYRRQMELYARALSGRAPGGVAQMLLYSFALEAVCPVEPVCQETQNGTGEES